MQMPSSHPNIRWGELLFSSTLSSQLKNILFVLAVYFGSVPHTSLHERDLTTPGSRHNNSIFNQRGIFFWDTYKVPPIKTQIIHVLQSVFLFIFCVFDMGLFIINTVICISSSKINSSTALVNSAVFFAFFGWLNIKHSCDDKTKQQNPKFRK